MKGVLLISIQAILLPLTFIITYLISTSLDHVEERFPYISDTGTYAPESCIFGFLLAGYSALTFLAVYGRWELVNSHHDNSLSCLNNSSLFTGIIAALGVLLVANFQETKVISVHLLGAFMAFFIGAVYMWLNSIISYRALLIPGYSRAFCHIRLVISGLTTVSALLTGILAGVAQGLLPADFGRTDTPGSGMWNSSMSGFDIHIASTSFEWVLAGMVSLYFLSFWSEFRHIRFGMPTVRTLTNEPLKSHSGLGNTGYIENEDTPKY